MRIFIAGLGLIGASYAEGLFAKGHVIDAWNRSEETVGKAVRKGFVRQETKLSDIEKADLVILALYPEHNVRFLESHGHLLRSGQIVTDVSGTKVHMMDAIHKVIPEGVTYTSHHPMAGKEKSGFDARDPDMFKGANAIIVKGKKSGTRDEDVIRTILSDLGFGRVLVTDATTHDALIAYTSQLTHVIAVSLVNSDRLHETKAATGDSFRDLTRIAKINETMWTALFLDNKDALLDAIGAFERELAHLKSLIEEDKVQEIKDVLRHAKEKRVAFDNIDDQKS